MLSKENIISYFVLCVHRWSLTQTKAAWQMMPHWERIWRKIKLCWRPDNILPCCEGTSQNDRCLSAVYQYLLGYFKFRYQIMHAYRKDATMWCPQPQIYLSGMTMKWLKKIRHFGNIVTSQFAAWQKAIMQIFHLPYRSRHGIGNVSLFQPN